MPKKCEPLGWNYEEEWLAQGISFIAGVDEVGRGCLAGPVIAAAVIFLDRKACPSEVNDSKKLSRDTRRRLHESLTTSSLIIWSVGISSVEEIDKVNVLRACDLAMKRAIDELSLIPEQLLVDGLRVPLLGKKQQAIVKGDSQSPSIAAASIIAKETRDCLMEKLEIQYPGYGFAKHKGYGTSLHHEALKSLGPSPEHRRSFAPVAAFLDAKEVQQSLSWDC